MFNELQKFARKKIIARVILSVVALIILLIFFGSSFLKLVQGPTDLDSLSLDELPGAYIETDAYVLIDSFAEYTETDKSGSESTTDLYYIIPVGEVEYMGMGVKPKDFNEASQICDETYEYMMDERDELTSFIHIKGTIKEMDEELAGFYYDWFEETGYIDYSSREELEQYAIAYVIEPETIGVFEGSIVYLVLAVCAVLILCIIINIVMGSTGACLSQIKKFIANNESTDSLEAIEDDYRNATVVETVRVGKNYTFYFKGIKAIVVKNSDIIWAYLKRVTHRTNGIKTHVTRSLMLNTSNKSLHTIDMRSEDAVGEVIEQYSINNPHIILGYSEELEKCYKKDINSFINLSRQQGAANANAAAANAAAANAAAANGQQGVMARVVIVNSGDNNIKVIAAIRDILQCGLKEAKDLVDNLPSVMLDNIPLNDALAIKEELESHGATVKIENVI